MVAAVNMMAVMMVMVAAVNMMAVMMPVRLVAALTLLHVSPTGNVASQGSRATGG
jgi:hypothetical protein